MPNLNASERALGATMIQLTAESQGKTTEAYLQASFRDGKLFGDTQEMDSAMQGKKGAVSFTNDLKAVIYAGEKADFSTFTHETFHVAMRNMGQTEQFRTAVTEASQTPEFITWLDDHAELFKDSVFDGKDAKGLAELAADFGSENWGRPYLAVRDTLQTERRHHLSCRASSSASQSGWEGFIPPSSTFFILTFEILIFLLIFAAFLIFALFALFFNFCTIFEIIFIFQVFQDKEA